MSFFEKLRDDFQFGIMVGYDVKDEIAYSDSIEAVTPIYNDKEDVYEITFRGMNFARGGTPEECKFNARNRLSEYFYRLKKMETIPTKEDRKTIKLQPTIFAGKLDINEINKGWE